MPEPLPLSEPADLATEIQQLGELKRRFKEVEWGPLNLPGIDADKLTKVDGVVVKDSPYLDALITRVAELVVSDQPLSYNVLTDESGRKPRSKNCTRTSRLVGRRLTCESALGPWRREKARSASFGLSSRLRRSPSQAVEVELLDDTERQELSLGVRYTLAAER